MNYLLSLCYLLFHLTFCYGTGSLLIRKIGLGSVYASKSVICGFLYLSAVQFVFAFPAQFFHIPWFWYFWMMLIVYFLHLCYIIHQSSRWGRSLFLQKARQHIASYWILYGMALSFFVMSIASQFPYFELNYDDSYYLGSLVQEIGSPALGSVNYFNGMKAGLDITRMCNTLGLQYAFWAVCFHIEPVAFARIAAVLQNYILLLYGYHMLFSEIKKAQRNSQFYLIPLVLLLIPAGYYHAHGIISMYDDWQFHTAIWYGSSLVRLLALPILLLFGHDLITQFTIRKLLWWCMLVISFFSFSSIVLPIVIVTAMILLFTDLWKRISQRPYGVPCFIFLVIVTCIILYIVPEYLYEHFSDLRTAMDAALIGYRKYANSYLSNSLILTVCLPIMLVIACFRKNQDANWYDLILILCFMLLFSSIFDKFIVLISMNYNFVGLRFTTSLQFMILMLFGMEVMSCIKSRRWNLGCLMFLFCFANVFNYLHLGEYRNLSSYESSGLSVYGFSPHRAIMNDHAMPKILLEIGQFFASIDTRTHVLAATTIPYEGAEFRLSESLVYASNHVTVYSEDGNLKYEKDRTFREERERMKAFADGNEVAEITSLLQKYGIDYIITQHQLPDDQKIWNIEDELSYDQGILYIYRITM